MFALADSGHEKWVFGSRGGSSRFGECVEFPVGVFPVDRARCGLDLKTLLEMRTSELGRESGSLRTLEVFAVRCRE